MGARKEEEAVEPARVARASTENLRAVNVEAVIEALGGNRAVSLFLL